MFKRVPQPPIDPAARATERHGIWPGMIGGLLGLALVIGGALRAIGVDTTDGDSAREHQLIKAFASGGLKYASRQAPAPPPNLEGVENPAEVLDRWARDQAKKQEATWKVRVDTSAKTPCPT